MADEVITDQTSAGDLRKMYEKAQEKLRTAEAELDTFRSEKRTSSVADILKAKGAPAAAAKFYTGDVSEAAVASWLEENKELFPVSTAASAGETKTTTVVDPNTAAARAVTSATAGSSDAGEAEPVRDGTGRVLGDPAELMQLLRNTPRSPEGYQQLVRLGLMPSDPNQI